MLQHERPSSGPTGGDFRRTARREEVGSASKEKADEEDGGLSAVLLCSQVDSESPIVSVWGHTK